MVSRRLLCSETTNPPCLQEMAWCPRGPIIIIIYRTADILVTNWATASQQPSMSLLHLRSILAPLRKRACTQVLQQEQLSSGSTLKMTLNVSWKCIPLAVECYGARGPEALKAFSQVATRLAIHGNTSKSMALTDLFGRLSHSLIRANARAILSRSYSHFLQQVDEL